MHNGDCVKQCSFNGTNYFVWDTVTAYSAQDNCSAACSTTTATCQNNGKRSKTIYANCEKKKKTCEDYPGFQTNKPVGVCLDKETKFDGCWWTLTCYGTTVGCPAEYVCAQGLDEWITDYIEKADGDYCVRNSGTTCFIEWTKVTMADGSQKDIEDVKIWEKVLWSNKTINTVLWYDRPLLWNRHLWSINGSEYFVSDEHPFMTIKGWKSFNPAMTKLEIDLNTTELKVWDVLITDNGLEEIKTVGYINEDYNTPLYNLILDGDHTYYANSYLVHNKGDDIVDEECSIISPYVSSTCSIWTCGLWFSVVGIGGDQQVSGPIEICAGDTIIVDYCIRWTSSGEPSCSDHQACEPTCYAWGDLPDDAHVVCAPAGDC